MLFMSGCNITGCFAFFSKGMFFFHNCLFYLSVESNSYFLWFCTITDWFKKSRATFPSIKSKTRSKCDS